MIPSHSSHPTYPAIVARLTGLASRTTGVPKAALLQKDDLKELGLDQLDLVNLILAVEKVYHITIPDEVPIRSLTDIARFVHAQAAA